MNRSAHIKSDSNTQICSTMKYYTSTHTVSSNHDVDVLLDQQREIGGLQHDVEQPRQTPRELVVRPSWSDELADSTLRSGQVCDPGATGVSGLFHHTVGDHLLVRGRWLSLPRMRAALAGIDGIAGLRLEVSRGEGTLDKLVVSLAFERQSLVENPMWAARAREAVASTTPIAFEVETRLARDEEPAEEIRDLRGHHLGVERAAVAGASAA